jgi:hypothetical protein
MTKQIDGAERAGMSAAHRRAWDAIPWIVNGTASDVQRRAVEAHLRDCGPCRDEIERQRVLHAALSAPGAAPDAPGVEHGLARLMARIDDSGRDGATAPAEAMGATAPTGAITRRRHVMAALVCTLLGAVVIEAVGIAILAVDRRGDADAPFRTLTQAPAVVPQATLRIVPAPTMTVSELQKLLLDLRLQIVAGPNEAGAYALAPLAGPPSTDSQLARLRAVPGVRFAEPIAAREAAR